MHDDRYEHHHRHNDHQRAEHDGHRRGGPRPDRKPSDRCTADAAHFDERFSKRFDKRFDAHVENRAGSHPHGVRRDGSCHERHPREAYREGDFPRRARFDREQRIAGPRRRAAGFGAFDRDSHLERGERPAFAGGERKGRGSRRPSLERSILKTARRIAASTDLHDAGARTALRERVAASVSHADYVTTMRTLRTIGEQLDRS